MARRRTVDPAQLPQQPETWAVSVHQLRVWIVPEDEPPSRPWIIFIIDLDNDVLLGPNLCEPAPDAEAVHTALLAAMRRPPAGAGRPRRPTRIVCPDADLAARLAPDLAALNIACEMDALPMLPGLIGDLEDAMREGQPEPPGLLSVAGVTPEMAGGVFAAAAEFYRQAPWVHLLNEQSFMLRIPAPEGPARIAVIMGNAGVEYGLAVYNRWEDVEKLYYGADTPAEALPKHDELALFFSPVHQLPFTDLEALEKYGWEAANDEAYPVPVVINTSHEPAMRRPTPAELAWLEAALLAIPRLVSDYLKPGAEGDYQPFEATLAVATHAGDVTLAAKYPAGVISPAERPLHAPDLEWADEAEAEDDEEEAGGEPLTITPHMMERMMAEMAADLPGVQPLGDKKLQQAQKLMYQAWEADNPARRLALAHEALALSPDCADAYVLLAEEEADTVGRALTLYQQGVQAGERALGPAFFDEAAGHFWGILETRPYMRAREGVAHCLWQLNRRPEAVEHYQALLQLNPEDNQGVRYLMTTLLLELDRPEDLAALLKAYKQDSTAVWLYTWALAEFRKRGPHKESDRRLKKALKQNPHVPAYLLGRKRVPNQLPPYMGLGDEDEAAHYAADHLNHWRRTPGAVQWLEASL